MKAIIVREFGEPEVMKLEEVPMPEPDGTQVLVRIKAAGVNPVDTYIRSGNRAVKPNLPYTPGKDGAGIVESLGEAVTRFKRGDRVYTANTLTGTYAELALCDESHLGSLPENVSFEEGAGIWTPYATAYRALFEKANGKAGETVLIHGASGGVGIAAIQWAKNAGLIVIGTASSDEGKQLVEEQGADAVFDHTSDEHFAEILEFTGGKGPGIIIEMLANVNLQKDFDVLAMFGRVVVVGSRGSLEFDPRAVMTKDAAIYGLLLFNARPETVTEIHAAIYNGLNSGYVKPHIRKSLRLNEAVKGHHDLIENKALGKIVLVP